MYKSIAPKPVVINRSVPSSKHDGVPFRPMVVDQTPAAIGHLNKFGYPMSDIQLLMECNDVMLQQNIASRLEVLQEQQPDGYDKLSDSEKIAVLQPRWVQTPSEIERFQEYLNVRREQSVALSRTLETTTTEPDAPGDTPTAAE